MSTQNRHSCIILTKNYPEKFLPNKKAAPKRSLYCYAVPQPIKALRST